MKKTIFSTIILLTVTGCAVTQPEDELSLTRSKLEHFLQTREMTQSEMNLINSYALQLSNMEKACTNTVSATAPITGKSKKPSKPTAKHGKNSSLKSPSSQVSTKAAPSPLRIKIHGCGLWYKTASPNSKPNGERTNQ